MQLRHRVRGRHWHTLHVDISARSTRYRRFFSLSFSRETDLTLVITRVSFIAVPIQNGRFKLVDREIPENDGGSMDL